MVTEHSDASIVTPPTFDVAETAPLIKVSPRTLRRMAERREIGHYRVGRRLLFSDQDIAEFLKKSRVPANH